MRSIVTSITGRSSRAVLIRLDMTVALKGAARVSRGGVGGIATGTTGAAAAGASSR
jgi:hypothetical protein